MRAPHGNNLLSAGQGLSTKLLQDLAPRVSAFFIRRSFDRRKWNERPSRSFSAKYVGEEGGVRFGLYHMDYSSTHSKKSFWDRACVSSRIHRF